MRTPRRSREQRDELGTKNTAHTPQRVDDLLGQCDVAGTEELGGKRLGTFEVQATRPTSSGAPVRS